MDRTLVLLLLLACLALTAGEAQPRVELSATPAQVAVGETVQVVVTYSWPRGWTTAEPDPAAAFRDCFVTAAPPAERLTTGEQERRVHRYTVAATRSGAWSLPRPSFAARGPAGTVQAEAPEVIVQVGAESAPPKLPAARPMLIRPPEALPVRRWPWLVGGSGLVIAVVALWWFRRRAGVSSGPSAWQVFTDELAAARTASDSKDAGARLSLAVRRYAGRTWGFDGPGATTRELGGTLARLRAGSITDEESRDLLRLLGRLDDLRWSAGDAPAEAMSDLATLAHSWTAGVQGRLDAEAAARAAAGGKVAR